ncbi:MAG: PKD domain-containing protein [Bacteroidia bacterium]
MNYSKKIFTAFAFSLTSVYSFAQTVDASPETQTICSGGSATLTAVILPSGSSSLPTTSYALSTIPYAPDPFGSGTVVPGMSDDSQSPALPIGFNFEFFGTCYSQFYVGSNGWVAFTPQPTTYTSSSVPSVSATVPKNCIMGPWQDWYPGLGTNVVRYQTYGTAPNRRLVVSWNACPMFSCTTTLGTFQITIYESTNVIETHIQNKPNCLAWAGGTAVHGLHNAAGTVAFVVPGRNSTAWTTTNEGRRWTPNGVFTPTINWYVLPSNTLVGTGTPITVTPPAGAPSTSYYASLTGGSGCGSATSRDTVVVLQTIVPAVTAGNNGPICAGQTLNLTCTPAVAGAVYSWTGPGGYTSTLQNPSRPAATIFMSGTYTLSISVAGCPGIPVTTSVTINPIPAAPVAAATTPICSGSTLNLSTTSAGPGWNWTGPAGFTSSLQNPSILSATTAASGTYSVTATSAAGCTSSPGTVNVTVNPTPVAPTVANQSVCFGTTATLTASVSGPTYQWYDAPGGTLLATGATYTTPPVTTTTNYYVQTNAAGCIGPMTTVTVTVAPSIVANAGPDDSICNGASYVLGAGPTGGYTYTWDAPGTPGFSTSATPTVTPASTTTYTVTVTDALGCTGTDAVTITVGSPLLVNVTSVPASCFGSCDGTATGTPSGSFGAYMLDWTPGSPVGDGTSNISALCTGSYTVTVTDMQGCTATGSTTVTQPTLLTLATSFTTSHCSLPDGTATVNASGSSGTYSYLWSDGQTTSTANNLVPATYTVTVTDVINGCTATATVTVPNTPGVSVTITSTPVSCNSLCDGTASVTGSSGVTPYSYLWSPAGQITPGITGLCPGTYTCTITDASGCTATATATITQPAPILIDAIPPVTICQGQTTTLNATATGGHPLGGYTFNWNAPAFTGPSNTVSPMTTTTYTVTALDTAGCASQSPVMVTVTVNPPLSVTASPAVSICPGSSTMLTATAGGGDGTYVYSWMPGSGLSSTFNVTPAGTTTYTITLTDGCTTTPATATVTVTVLPLPVIAFTPLSSTGCSPVCVTFADATTVTGGSVASWLWGFGDGSTANTQNPSHCFSTMGGGLTTYDVTLTATSNGGCTSSATFTNVVTVYANPVAAFSFNPDPASMASPNVSFIDLSTNASSWSWNFNDPANTLVPNTSNSQNPSHMYGDAGTYCVTLVASNLGGCTDTTVNCVTIEPEFTFYIPNAFSPNGDGINDIFAPKGDNIAEFTMRIFDRWGNQVFISKALNEGWDGKVKGGSGEIAEEDVYVYNITVKEKIGSRRNYIGHVTIVK